MPAITRARCRVPNRSGAAGQRGRSVPSAARADDLRLTPAERLATRVGPRRAPECRTCSIASLHLFLCDRWHGHIGDCVHDRLDGPAGVAHHSLAPAGDCGRTGAARADVCRAHAGDSHPPRRCQPTANATGARPGGLRAGAGTPRGRERRVSWTTRRRPPSRSRHLPEHARVLGHRRATRDPRCATLRRWAQLSFTTCAWRFCCWRWPARGWPTCSPCRAIG